MQTSSTKEPYSFMIFKGGGGGWSRLPVPPLDPHMGLKFMYLISLSYYWFGMFSCLENNVDIDQNA